MSQSADKRLLKVLRFLLCFGGDGAAAAAFSAACCRCCGPTVCGAARSVFGAATTMLLHSAAELRIADLLAKDPLTAAEIAARCKTDPALTERLLRALVGIGVFARSEDGKYRNNRVAQGLRTGVPGSVRGFVEFFGIPEIVDAWRDLPNVLRHGGVGFQRVHGRGVWEWLATSKVGADSFVEGMSSMTEEVSSSIAAAYPFDEVKKSAMSGAVSELCSLRRSVDIHTCRRCCLMKKRCSKSARTSAKTWCA